MRRKPTVLSLAVLCSLPGVVLAADPLLEMSEEALNQEVWGGDACAEWVLQADSFYHEVKQAKAGTRTDERIRQQHKDLALKGEAPSSPGYQMTEYLIDNAVDGMGREALRRGVLKRCRQYAPDDVRMTDAWRPNPEYQD